MNQPPCPRGRDSDPGPDRQHRAYQLRVWPSTATAPWRAELSAEGDAAPRCFVQPDDLLRFLSEPQPARPVPGGLR